MLFSKISYDDLMLILEYLDVSSLKNLRLVSKDFNNTILQSPVFIKKVAEKKKSILCNSNRLKKNQVQQSFNPDEMEESRKEKFLQQMNFIESEHQAFKKFYLLNKTNCQVKFISPLHIEINAKTIWKLRIFEGCLCYIEDEKGQRLYVVVKSIFAYSNYNLIKVFLVDELTVAINTEDFVWFGAVKGSAPFHQQKYCTKKFFGNQNGDDILFPTEIQNTVLLENLSSCEYKMYTNKMNAVESCKNKIFSAIVGPPGTGKTETLVEFAKQSSNEEKVMILSYQNSVADNLAQKVQFQLKMNQDERSVYRVNSDAKKKMVQDENLSTFCIEGFIERNLQSFSYFDNFTCFKYHVYLKLIRFFAYSFKDKSHVINLKATLLKDTVQLMIQQNKANILISTIGATTKLPKLTQFDLVLVDEAGCLKDTDIIVAATLVKPSGRLVIFGDPNQLEFFKYDDQIDSKSLLRKLIERKSDRVLWMNIQYRIIPFLGEILNELFYNVNMIYPESNGKKWLSLPNGQHLKIITHSGNDRIFNEEESELLTISKSFINLEECAIIKSLLNELPYLINDKDALNNLVILTSYAAQKYVMCAEIPEHASKIYTIDQYQGLEKKIVILSLVRQNKDYKIGFLANKNRMCTALSRASDIIILVCGKMFTEGRMPEFLDNLFYLYYK